MLPKYWILQTKLHKSPVLTYTLKICTKVHNKGDLPLGRLCYFMAVSGCFAIEHAFCAEGCAPGYKYYAPLGRLQITHYPKGVI
jgi:hypothetical protein